MKCFMTSQDCIFEKDIKAPSDNTSHPKRIFVVSPFGYPYEYLYNNIIRPFYSEEGDDALYVTRADREIQLGFVMCQKICREIRMADFVLVDLSEPNPNVYYELGLAMGFKKKILIISTGLHQLNKPFGTPWETFLRSKRKTILSYDELKSYLAAKDRKGLVSLFEKHAYDSAADVERMHDPTSYIYRKSNYRKSDYGEANREILFCVSTPFNDDALLLDIAQESVEQEDWRWCIKQKYINRVFDIDAFMNDLSSCKVCMVDISSYADSINPNTYWLLGFAHALGRDAIPLTNRARSGDYTPFDIRGLYQIYFDSLKGFKEGLTDIIKVIEDNYKIEISEYPQRYLWNNIFSHSNQIKVVTFGRGSTQDPRRDGGRTNVDRWDYQAVANLSFFLAQKFKQAEVKIQPPEDKRVGRKEEETLSRKRQIEKELSGGNKNYIIIGSPDVSDYAEIILAKAYNIEPYKPLICKYKHASCLKVQCDEPCIGRSGYIFLKKKFFGVTPQEEEFHPRLNSFCYRDAETDEYILWYGKRIVCTNARENTNGTTYGVISIFYEYPLAPPKGGADNGKSSIIVLSGFSGIATYGLAVLISGSNDRQSKKLHDLMRIHKEKKAIQILVRVEYEINHEIKTHEARIFKDVDVVEVQPFISVVN